jgi:hypothetical protein
MRIMLAGLAALFLGWVALGCSDDSGIRSLNLGAGGGGGTGGVSSGTGGTTVCPPCAAPPLDCVYGLLPGTGPCGCGATCAPAPESPDAGIAQGSDSGATQLPACRWPAALDPTDGAATGQCRAARAFVTCQDGTGGGQGCLSNDPMRCPDLSAQPAVGLTCQNECAANEYGAACGSVGPSTAPFPTPPTGCRMVAPTPGGIAFYCCPCNP